MYRDLIGAPERIDYQGREWWMQVICKWSGELDTVLLFDADGELAGEFDSEAAAWEYIEAQG